MEHCVPIDLSALVVIVTVDKRIVIMPKGQRKGSASASEAINESLNGDMHSAIIVLIENKDLIIANFIESISQAIIARLIDNTHFAKKIINSILNSDLIGNMKQELCKSSQMDISLAAAEAAKIAARLSQLETEKLKLSNEIDMFEQYSRRNCLIIHGVLATADPETIVLDIINNKLSIPIDVTGSERLQTQQIRSCDR